MKSRIHYTLQNGTTDFIDIKAETLNEIRELAKDAVELCSAEDYWSEEIT